jgi:hypothetical protein
VSFARSAATAELARSQRLMTSRRALTGDAYTPGLSSTVTVSAACRGLVAARRRTRVRSNAHRLLQRRYRRMAVNRRAFAELMEGAALPAAHRGGGTL